MKQIDDLLFSDQITYWDTEKEEHISNYNENSDETEYGKYEAQIIFMKKHAFEQPII